MRGSSHACRGHPCLDLRVDSKSWMAGTSQVKPAHDNRGYRGLYSSNSVKRGVASADALAAELGIDSIFGRGRGRGGGSARAGGRGAVDPDRGAGLRSIGSKSSDGKGGTPAMRGLAPLPSGTPWSGAGGI